MIKFGGDAAASLAGREIHISAHKKVKALPDITNTAMPTSTNFQEVIFGFLQSAHAQHLRMHIRQ